MRIQHIGGAQGCSDNTGFVDVTSVEYGRNGSLLEVRKFAATYEVKCDITVKGSVQANYPVGTVVDLPFGPAKSEEFGCGVTGDPTDGGGGTTGDTPPATPPPPFQIKLPSDFDTNPLILTNSSSSTLAFSSAVDQSTFNSDIHLSVTTDALDEENFHASITPDRIAAPGAGDAKVTITTGPLTFPRVYAVTLTATSDSGETFSRTLLVQVTCDPPFILGTDQPKSITAANGAQATLGVKPTGTGPFFYQWYRGVPGMTRSPVLAANESKLIFTTRETATYWVRVSNACGTADSNAVTVTTTGTLAGPAHRRGSGH